MSGVGKTTVASSLAAALGRVFIDADDLHPAENKAKMGAGTPLTDDDRWPWLDAVGLRSKQAAVSRRMLGPASPLPRIPQHFRPVGRLHPPRCKPRGHRTQDCRPRPRVHARKPPREPARHARTP
ncbi:shikimate kinase [Sinomonas atrocyanea]|uniref:shikimate kinase n=1 Tax=Sinomonas atrocyanea TaxID=37927 RepID=UPI0027D921DA|nr:shikimate kinase [Sinomonas atrocyanea]